MACACPTCGQPIAKERSPAPVGLTPKQSKLLAFVADYQSRNGGVTPSFDEMKDALNLKSKSGIARLMHGLEERGAIRRLPGRARAIQVVRQSTP